MSKRYIKRVRKVETMHLPPSAAGGNKRWSLEDTKYLLAHSTTDFIEDIALELGRTDKATKDKAFLMGCSIKSKGTTK